MTALPEFRPCLGSVTVTAPRSLIPGLKAVAPQWDIVPPVALPGLDSVAVRVHVLKADKAWTSGSTFYYIDVSVDPLPPGTDVVIEGKFSKMPRSWCAEAAAAAHCPHEPAPAAFLRGTGGRLASFLFGFTQEVIGSVTVYGAPSGGVSTDTLRREGTFCDVVLRADATDFPVHRVVLSSQSPVFHAMFTRDFKEAGDSRVTIPIQSPATVFGRFLEFMYTGVADFRGESFDDVVALLELADQYLVDRLKDECIRRLLEVGADGVVGLLLAALKKPFVTEPVLVHALNVALDNWDAVVQTAEWKTFQTDQPSEAIMLKSFLAREKQRKEASKPSSLR